MFHTWCYCSFGGRGETTTSQVSVPREVNSFLFAYCIWFAVFTHNCYFTVNLPIVFVCNFRLCSNHCFLFWCKFLTSNHTKVPCLQFRHQRTCKYFILHSYQWQKLIVTESLILCCIHRGPLKKVPLYFCPYLCNNEIVIYPTTW